MKDKEPINHFIAAQRREINDASAPLEGLRIIGMAEVIGAPFAASLLGDYGAEMIKVKTFKKG